MAADCLPGEALNPAKTQGTALLNQASRRPRVVQDLANRNPREALSCNSHRSSPTQLHVMHELHYPSLPQSFTFTFALNDHRPHDIRIRPWRRPTWTDLCLPPQRGRGKHPSERGGEKQLLRIPPRKLFARLALNNFCAAERPEQNCAPSLSVPFVRSHIKREAEFCQTAQSRVKRKREGRRAQKDTFFG